MIELSTTREEAVASEVSLVSRSRTKLVQCAFDQIIGSICKKMRTWLASELLTYMSQIRRVSSILTRVFNKRYGVKYALSCEMSCFLGSLPLEALKLVKNKL